MRTRLLAMKMLLGLVIGLAPLAAQAAAPGWSSEARWSGSDDWEPTIAADPSSNWVYQATTRYGGPKACSSCPGTAIISAHRVMVGRPGVLTGSSARAGTSR